MVLWIKWRHFVHWVLVVFCFFMFVLLTRLDREFLYEILGEVIKVGATMLNIPDTVGITMPNEFGKLIANIKANIPGVKNYFHPLSEWSRTFYYKHYRVMLKIVFYLNHVDRESEFLVCVLLDAFKVCVLVQGNWKWQLMGVTVLTLEEAVRESLVS